MQVAVHDNVPTTFMRLFGADRTAVSANATCGLSNVLSPVPILVLNPNAGTAITQDSASPTSTLVTDVGFVLRVLGGGEKSIQVNSISSNIDLDAGMIDLTEANNGNGGDVSVAKPEAQPPGTILYGASGKWVQTAGIISDPFATISAPGAPPDVSMSVETHCLGDSGNPSCQHYVPGHYPNTVPCVGTVSQVASICVNGSPATPTTPVWAVFDPGVYYLDGDLFAGMNSCLRSLTTGGDGTGGTMFYLAGAATLNVLPNSGANCPAIPGAPITGPVSVATAACSTNGDLGLPSTVTEFTGNVLLAPCVGAYGDPSGRGTTRGILFFHDRGTEPASQPSWSPGGSFALVGNLYFHYCDSASAGSGATCSSAAFTDTLSLGSGAPSYIVGGIVVDQLSLLTGSDITVSLNPAPQYYVLKASLLQ
jgi:hypothetical protein